MESDAAGVERLNVPLLDACHPAGRRPHIIMIHDESSFDIRQAQGIKVTPVDRDTLPAKPGERASIRIDIDVPAAGAASRSGPDTTTAQFSAHVSSGSLTPFAFTVDPSGNRVKGTVVLTYEIREWSQLEARRRHRKGSDL